MIRMKRHGSWSILLVLLISAFIFASFRAWFSWDLISAGDLHFLHDSYLEQLISWPKIWRDENKLPSLYSYPSQFLGGVLSRAGFSFLLIERVLWLYPYLIFSFLGMYMLAKRWIPKPWVWLSCVLFTVNTYSLMI